jgi:hypothetical protein
MRIAGNQEIVIAADSDMVWRMISDVTRTHEWSPDVLQSTWIDAGPAVGARFDSLNRMPLVRRWRSRSTVTVCEPGRRFGFGTGGTPAHPNTSWTWDLEPDPAGVRVRLSYKMHREPLIVLIYYRLTNRAERVSRSVRATLKRLKDLAERSSPK